MKYSICCGVAVLKITAVKVGYLCNTEVPKRDKGPSEEIIVPAVHVVKQEG